MLTLLESDIVHLKDMTTLRRIHLRIKASVAEAVKKLQADKAAHDLASVTHLLTEYAIMQKVEEAMANNAEKSAVKSAAAKRKKKKEALATAPQ